MGVLVCRTINKMCVLSIERIYLFEKHRMLDYRKKHSGTL
jgi:hypothetical protein